MCIHANVYITRCISKPHSRQWIRGRPLMFHSRHDNDDHDRSTFLFIFLYLSSYSQKDFIPSILVPVVVYEVLLRWPVIISRKKQPSLFPAMKRNREKIDRCSAPSSLATAEESGIIDARWTWDFYGAKRTAWTPQCFSGINTTSNGSVTRNVEGYVLNILEPSTIQCNLRTNHIFIQYCPSE